MNRLEGLNFLDPIVAQEIENALGQIGKEEGVLRIIEKESGLPSRKESLILGESKKGLGTIDLCGSAFFDVDIL